MGYLGVRIYRLAAKAMGIALSHQKIVESVYASRGVGRGEITFGRSDFDFTIIVRTPDPHSADGPELYSLYRKVCALRRVNPALTHIMVHDARGIDRWMRADSYYGSMDRRSMFLLAGKSPPLPDVPVRSEDALRWIALQLELFFPLAVQRHNRRNLHKAATEIWKASAVARHYVSVPYLTLRETRQKAREYPDGEGLAKAGHTPQLAAEYVLRLAGALHSELLPPLRKLQETKVVRVLLPPESRHRVLVILPHPGASLPAAVFDPDSLITTPEMLHLHMHYLNPFLDWNLPPELRRLGFTTPQPDQFVRACRYYGQDNRLRFPGFVRPDTWCPGAAIALNQHSIPYLRNSEVPPPIPESIIRTILDHPPNYMEYYQRDFAQLYQRLMEQSMILEQLGNSGASSLN